LEKQTEGHFIKNSMDSLDSKPHKKLFFFCLQTKNLTLLNKLSRNKNFEIWGF
jgi:hypothetical protein